MEKSVKDIAKLFGCSTTDAYGFVKFLCSQNLAKQTGSRKSSTGRGKPEGLYTINNDAMEVLKGKCGL